MLLYLGPNVRGANVPEKGSTWATSVAPARKVVRIQHPYTSSSTLHTKQVVRIQHPYTSNTTWIGFLARGQIQPCMDLQFWTRGQIQPSMDLRFWVWGQIHPSIDTDSEIEARSSPAWIGDSEFEARSIPAWIPILSLRLDPAQYGSGFWAWCQIQPSMDPDSELDAGSSPAWIRILSPRPDPVQDQKSGKIRVWICIKMYWIRGAVIKFNYIKLNKNKCY